MNQWKLPKLFLAVHFFCGLASLNIYSKQKDTYTYKDYYQNQTNKIQLDLSKIKCIEKFASIYFNVISA